MILEYNVFPDFYKKYTWLPEEEENDHEYFVGCTHYLESFWRNLCGLVHQGPFSKQNKAYIGQRKLGKTALLKRCYNIAFWEQEEIIPFYYCFPQKKKVELRKIADEIALKFLQQAISFITKDKEFIQIEEDIENYLLEREEKAKEVYDKIQSTQNNLTEIRNRLQIQRGC